MASFDAALNEAGALKDRYRMVTVVTNGTKSPTQAAIPVTQPAGPA
jgi:hypothetical protein